MDRETYGPRTPAWRKLEAKAAELESISIRSLFDDDPDRGERFSLEACGLWFDFSRQRLDREALDLLVELAEQTEVPRWIERMFAGERINNTEDRAALHVALRRPADQPIYIDGENVMPLVEAERQKMRAFADKLHAGELKGWTGKAITDVVNIGIGGSDLGIVMAVEALAEYRKPALGVHFVSNIDGVALTHVLDCVDPERTLFVICSKSFTTLETLTNAQAARAWLIEHGGAAAVAAQTIAVSTNHEAMDEFGIAREHRLAMWDWVGGRYSLWSAVGLTVALAVGWENFEEFLCGGCRMDDHFQSVLPAENLPVMLALIGVWNRNFQGAASYAILPYDDHLKHLPAYLQQLEMESNGKSVRRNGEPVECATCPVIFGEPGSNAQHSFYQLLHQGTERVAIDFILSARSGTGTQSQQTLTAANCLAQAWALAGGDPDVTLSCDNPHKYYAGSRPNTVLLLSQLDPSSLGRIIALYEHMTYIQGVLWEVNSFDQWGVELGKRLVSHLLPAMSEVGADPTMLSRLLAQVRALVSGKNGPP
jgi:glucose-6-phosphate isomerase